MEIRDLSTFLDYLTSVHQGTRRVIERIPPNDLENVIAYYDTLHAESKAIFSTLTNHQLNEKCLTPAGTPITTWKWLRAMLEHEAHHRGQLYLMLGMRGVTTPPIYGLTSEEVAARAGQR